MPRVHQIRCFPYEDSLVRTRDGMSVRTRLARIAFCWTVESRFSDPQGREADITEILARREQTGGALGLFRQIIAPKSGPPTHLHRANDEFFYIVSGEFKFKLGDRVVRTPARSIVFVPRGTAHTFENVGTEAGVLLVGVTPGGWSRCSRNGRV